MAMGICYFKHLSIITIILIYCLASSFCKQQAPELCTSGDCRHRDNDDGRILSRKRRALTFPEGSSLQLVYDQTIPIVAAQLLFTVGVTCALAFELPSEPLYHITQKLRQSLLNVEDVADQTSTPAPNDTSSEDDHSRIDKNYYDSMNKHSYYYSPNNYGNKYYQRPLSPNYISDKSDNYYNNFDNIYNKLSNQSSIFVTPRPSNQTKNGWTSLVSTFVNKFGQKVKTKKFMKKVKGKKKLGNVFIRKHNRVYPVFGKRSVDDHISDEEKFYMEHHRSTRFNLFEKIEGFLKGRGKDGKACVLRALCETGQKNQDHTKGPFLMEILRAVFSLPDQAEEYKNDAHKHFDDAHSKLDENCAELYSACQDSIWSESFKF